MTPNEAIRRIKEHNEVHSKKERRAILITVALNMAVKALEKQIPKKPKYKPKKEGLITTNYKCPSCGCRRLGHTKEIAYCPDCGQALDWSDSNA